MPILSVEEQIEADLRELEEMEAIEQAKFTPTISVPLSENQDYQTYRREAQKKKKAAQNRRAYERKKAELLATGYDPRLFDGRFKRVPVLRIRIADKDCEAEKNNKES